MITKEQIAAACRAHDNAADMGESMPEILAKRGIDARDAIYVAEQRALRLVLLASGRPMPDPTRMSQVALSASERKMFTQLTVMWLDGLAVGVKISEE